MNYEFISQQIGCKFCELGEIINTNGDYFEIFKDDDENYKLCSADKHFLTLKINYCPICGKEL